VLALEAPPDQAWIDGLRARDPRTLAELHALLLRAARFELRRRGAGPDLDDLAHHSAHDALLAILAKLDTFRGDSRFTTWAYKFALLEAAVKMRRRPWHGRELPLEPERWPQLADAGVSPELGAERAELLQALRRAIDEELTPQQREVLVAVALNGVPIDVLAERRGSTRGALYKTIHDARRKLRRRLQADGHV
jgi:RNA polymerase sigma-70 factor (ECF subfamily)